MLTNLNKMQENSRILEMWLRLKP